MIGAPSCGKLLFTLLLHDHSPQQFATLREDRLRGLISDPEIRERYRPRWDDQFPAAHRFNDVAGFAEVYWDGGTRILVELHMRANRSRKYGRAVSRWRSNAVRSDRFYLLGGYAVGGEYSFTSATPTAKLEAISEALSYVECEAHKLNCYVDLASERELLKALDVERLLFRR